MPWIVFALAAPLALDALWAGLLHLQTQRHLSWASMAAVEPGVIKTASRDAGLLVLRGQSWVTDPSDTTRLRLERIRQTGWCQMPAPERAAEDSIYPVFVSLCWAGAAAAAVLLTTPITNWKRWVRRSPTGTAGRLSAAAALWAGLWCAAFWIAFDRNNGAWFIAARPAPSPALQVTVALAAGFLTAFVLRLPGLALALRLKATRHRCANCRYPTGAGTLRCPECGHAPRSRRAAAAANARGARRALTVGVVVVLALGCCAAWWLSGRPRYAEFLQRWATIRPLNYDSATQRWD